MTRSVPTTERVPVIVVKMYEKGGQINEDKLIGISSLMTQELVSSEQPFMRVWKTVEVR